MNRILIVLACVSAVAFAQFGQTFQSQTRNQYQQQYQPQTTAPRNLAGACKERNERHSVPGICDKYIECINGTAEEKTCPDGLRYNPNVNFNVYPCQYPNEVSCLERSALQPADPTDQCPHRFGYFKLGDSRNCSHFRNCVDGVGYDSICPDGLAFNPETYRCEYPDLVPDCDVEAFLGFRCPEIPKSRQIGPPAGFRYYRSDVNCQKYFFCIDGKPRALYCTGEKALAFDELTSTCVPADEVDTCPSELRAAAARLREVEKLLLDKELEVSALSGFKKDRF